ncbi:MAG: B12-binding domain-containing radical SAM protein [Fimbriimonadaceae bacterium]|nr:B12-binding domain-containing radical SAM protein [Fimbriimonadaceae bacterium]
MASEATRPRVVLYNPQAVFYTLPLALVAVGSHLDRRRYDVQIIDARITPDAHQRLAAAAVGALCVGVTVLTGAPIRDALAASRAVKAAAPEVPVVWGGWHPSMFPAECLAEPAVDITVQAQGEVTFAELVDRLAAGQDAAGCAGSAYRSAAGRVVRNPPRPLADLNTLAPQDYGLLAVPQYYELKGRRQLDYISSQGCYFRCAFCADPFVYQRQWTGLAPERIGEELQHWQQRFHFDDVNFQDETFFTRLERVAAVAEEFLRRDLRVTWAATMRADQGHRMSDEQWALCKRSGLRRVLVGVESGSQAMMDRIQKDIKLEWVYEVAERARRHQVAVQFPFIVGFPGETPDDVAASLAVAKRLRQQSPLFTTPIFYFKPYPGTSITSQAVADGYQLPRTLEEWQDFDFVGSRGPWVSPQVYRRVEAFKFYSEVAYGPRSLRSRLFGAVARWRCHHDRYGLALEQRLAELVWRPARLA